MLLRQGFALRIKCCLQGFALRFKCETLFHGLNIVATFSGSDGLNVAIERVESHACMNYPERELLSRRQCSLRSQFKSSAGSLRRIVFRRIANHAGGSLCSRARRRKTERESTENLRHDWLCVERLYAVASQRYS